MSRTKYHFLILLMIALILDSGCAPVKAVAQNDQQETAAPILDARGYPVPPTDAPMPTKPKDYPAPDRSAVTPPPIFTVDPHAPTPTITFTPVPPNPQYSPTPGPTATLDPKIAPGPVRNSSLILPDNLQREEYPMQEGGDTYSVFLQIVARHPESGNRTFLPEPTMRDGSILQWKDGPLTILYDESIPQKAKVKIQSSGHEDFDFDCQSSMGHPIQNFAYTSDHWYAASFCPPNLDVIVDGVSMNQAKGYAKSTAFQLLDGKPLYLFEKDGVVGISYDGMDTPLDYDRLALYLGGCDICYPEPHHFEHMITFAAIKGDQLYYVAIGHFKN